MYENYWGLDCKPFGSQDPQRFYFPSEQHQAGERRPAVALVGEFVELVGADIHQGKLGRDKETIEEDKQADDEDLADE